MRFESTLHIITVIAVLMLFSQISTGPAGDASADEGTRSQPVVTVTLDQVAKEGQPTKYENDIVIFTGVVTADSVGPGSNVQSIEVELESTSENNWSTTISPSFMEFPPTGGSEPFTCSVIVPAGTSYMTVDTVTITGRAKAVPGTVSYTIPPQSAQVTVKQYYDFDLSYEGPYKKNDDGGVFLVEVTNQGNGIDKFLVDITNEDELETGGVQVGQSAESVEVDQNDSAEVEIYVNPDDSSVSGSFSVNVVVSSFGSESVDGLPLEREIDLDFRVKSGEVEVLEEPPDEPEPDGDDQPDDDPDGTDDGDDPDGTDGDDDPDGTDGVDGDDVTDDADGADSPDGADGDDGTDGADGEDGGGEADPVDGSDGTDGPDGEEGYVPGDDGVDDSTESTPGFESTLVMIAALVLTVILLFGRIRRRR